jgi:hypothetical protein
LDVRVDGWARADRGFWGLSGFLLGFCFVHWVSRRSAVGCRNYRSATDWGKTDGEKCEGD